MPAVGVWMEGAEAHSLGGGTEAKETEEKVHGEVAVARPNPGLGKALVIILCSYFALVGPQNGSSGTGLRACTVLPLC